MEFTKRGIDFCCVGLLLSIVIGAIIGVLFAFGYITGIVTAVWISFGIGILTLIIFVTALFIASTNTARLLTKCIKYVGKCLLFGIIGTIIMSLVALSVTLVSTAIPIIILVAIGGFFVSLLLIELIFFFICIIDKISGIVEERIDL